MIPAIGPRKTAYPDIKFKKTAADETMSHGTSANPPMSEQRIVPRLMLIHRGAIEVRSFANETELAEMLQQT
jgi:hypothetical protein